MTKQNTLCPTPARTDPRWDQNELFRSALQLQGAISEAHRSIISLV